MKGSSILTIGAVVLLAACSDGNGISEDKSGNNNGGGGAGGATSITSANALVVTRITYESALTAGVAAEFSGATGIVSVRPSVISKIDGSFATAITTRTASGNVPIPPTVEGCLEGGTTTLSGEIADPITPAFTQGDYFDIVYANCNDGFSTVNGSLYYVVDAFSGDLLSGQYDLTMTATFTDFQIATAADTIVSNGDVTVRLNSLQFPFVTASTSGDSLTVDANQSSHSLTNFAGFFTQDVDAAPSPFNQGSLGTIDSTDLPGIIDYSTPVEFVGFVGEYPSEGEFLVVAENSSVRLIALDNVNIQLEVDTDGNGTVDEVINSTWAELEDS